jgi:hypothetical protein
MKTVLFACVHSDREFKTNTPSKGPNVDGREQNEHGCGAVPIAGSLARRRHGAHFVGVRVGEPK